MSTDIPFVRSQHQARVPVTVLQISGEVNSQTYLQLLDQVDAAYADGTRNLILDLKDVPYVSSAGLRALHYTFTRLRTDAPGESDAAMSKGLRDGTFRSPHLKLLHVNATVHEVLKATGFDMYLEIHNNLKDALDSF